MRAWGGSGAGRVRRVSGGTTPRGTVRRRPDLGRHSERWILEPRVLLDAAALATADAVDDRSEPTRTPGTDTEAVLAELGMDTAAIDRLKQEGAVDGRG